MRKAAQVFTILVLFLVFVSALKSITNPEAYPTPNAPPAKHPIEPAPPAKPKTVVVPKPGEEITQEYFHHVMQDAFGACSVGIEDKLGSNIQWSHGIILGGFATRWPRFNRYQRDDGHLLIYGDDAEQMGTYGHWERINYMCEFDPKTKKVVDINVLLGRLPKIK